MINKLIIKKIKNELFKLYFGNLIFRKKNYLFKELKIMNNKYKVYKIDNARLYTNTLDVAYIDKENNVLPNVAIQLRNHKNSKLSDNFVFKNGTPKFPKKIKHNVFSLLCGAPGNDNYYHWFFDVLPRYYLFRKIFKFKNNDYFVVPNIKHEFQRESLKLLNIKNLINAYDVKHLKAKNIYIIPLDITGNKFPSKWIINEHKKFFLTKRKKKRKSINIYISRKDSHNKLRSISNENEVLEILKKNNFKEVRLSDLNMTNKINLFQSAKTIVGQFGAGLVNAIFSKKKTTVIEIKNKNTGNLYKNIILNSGLNYKSLSFKRLNYRKSFKNFDGTIHVEPKRLKKLLSTIKKN